MPKKKNTRSADPVLSDILASTLCLAAAALCLALFWFDLNSSLEKQNETPLGIISWKEKAASRRFLDRTLWDRLRQDSPVYSGDYIRTEADAQATINFEAGGTIALLGSSLIQIFLEGETPSVQLSGGEASISAADSEKGAIIFSSGDTRVRVQGGGAVSARGQDGALSVSVEKGSAVISAAGVTREAASGEAFALSERGVESAETFSVAAFPSAAALAVPALYTPAAGGVIRYQNEIAPARFRWNTPETYAGPPPERYILEAADNRAFTSPAVTVESREKGASVLLPQAGQWYWRVTAVYAHNSETRSSAARSFRIEEGAPDTPPAFIPPAPSGALRAVFPPDGYTIESPLARGARFTWKVPAGFNGQARFQLSRDRDFAALEVDEALAARFWQADALAAGIWYWRVVTETETSAPRSFTVAAPLAAPVPQGGADGVAINAAGQGVFEWQPVNGADYYEFRLYDDSDGNLLHTQNVTGNSARHSLAGYSGGDYRWTVQAFTEQRNNSTRRESPASHFTFTLDKPAPRTAAAARTTPRRTAPARRSPARTEQPAQTPAARASESRLPLEPPLLAMPEQNAVFNAERLRGSNGIKFSWIAVRGAQSYRFSLLNEAGREIASGRSEGQSYTLSDLSVLSNGRFRWQVTAERRGDAGLETGQAAEGRFSVSVPNLRRQNLNDIGTMYGSE